MRRDQDHIHEEGGTVFANERPDVPLVIRRYIDRVYYYRNKNNPEEAERVYFERELRPPVLKKKA